MGSVDPFLLVCRSGPQLSTHGRIMMSRNGSEIAPFTDPYNAGADLLRYYGIRFTRRRFPEDVIVENPDSELARFPK